MTTVGYDATASTPTEAKRLATAHAQLALAGFQVRQLATGGFFATAPRTARFFSELDDLVAYAAQMSTVRS